MCIPAVAVTDGYTGIALQVSPRKAFYRPDLMSLLSTQVSLFPEVFNKNDESFSVVRSEYFLQLSLNYLKYNCSEGVGLIWGRDEKEKGVKRQN